MLSPAKTVVVLGLYLLLSGGAIGAQGQLPAKGAVPETRAVRKAGGLWSKKQFILPKPAPGYSVSIDYPLFADTAILKARQLNEAMRLMLTKVAKQDQAQYLDYVSDKDNPDGANAKKQKDGSSLGGTFKVHKTSDNIVSVSFDLTSFYFGAAHPHNYHVTFNYELNPFGVITLANLGKNKTMFLKAISEQCAESLKKRIPNIDEAMLASGTEAKDSNFQNFVLSDQQIEFYFDDDQVTPHANAVEEPVGVSYKSIKRLLNTGSPIYKLAR